MRLSPDADVCGSGASLSELKRFELGVGLFELQLQHVDGLACFNSGRAGNCSEQSRFGGRRWFYFLFVHRALQHALIAQNHIIGSRKIQPNTASETQAAKSSA